MKKQNFSKQQKTTSKDNEKTDNSVKVAVIGAVVTLVATIISAIVAPIALEKIKEAPFPATQAAYTNTPFLVATTSTPQEIVHPIKTIPPKLPLGVDFEFNSKVDDLSTEELFLVYQDGSRLYLTNNSYMDRGGAFSPDNKLISFIRRIDRNGDGKIFWDDNADLYIMNSDGGNIIQVTDDFCDAGWGTWSPDGKYIAFSCEQTDVPDILFVYELSSGSITPIYADERTSSETWSPDGRYIAFYNSQNRVAIIEPNGNGYQVISDDVGSVSGLYWTIEGNIIFPFQDKGNLIYNPYDGTSASLDDDAEVNQLRLRIYQQMYNWSSYINLPNP